MNAIESEVQVDLPVSKFGGEYCEDMIFLGGHPAKYLP